MSFREAKDNHDLLKDLEDNYDIVVYFTGKDCGACHSLNPNLHKIVNRYEGLKFVKADMDHCDKIADICNITALPTFIMFRNSEIRGRVIGANLSNIIAEIDRTYL